jgi:hypothetical protein
LPIYKTTQIFALYKESRLRPLEIKLNLISQTFIAYIAHLDPRHPLYKRASKVTRIKQGDTRLARLLLSLPKAKTVNPLEHPPWDVRESC